MALLAIGQLHVQLFKAAFGRNLALFDIGELGLDFGQIRRDLGIARTGLLGQLRQAQSLNLQLMRTALRLSGFAACGDQTLRRIGIGTFGPHQCRARLVGNQYLGTHFFFEMLNFLRTRQKARLLGVLRVKRDAVRSHGVARRHINGFTGLQLSTLGKRFIKRGSRVATREPVHQHGAQPGVIDLEQIAQAGKAGRGRCSRRLCGAEKSQAGWRRILPTRAQKAAHHIKAADLQSAKALAQSGFQRIFPARLNGNAAP